MEKCIVCGRPLPEHINMCGYCGFSVKKQYFLSKHQYRAWMNDVVLPRRLALQQFELNKQRRQLEEQQRAFQEQQRQFEEQKSKEIVTESASSRPLTGWEQSGGEPLTKESSKQSTPRRSASDSWLPPGFRTRKWWKMLLAGGYYIFILAVMFTGGNDVTFSDGTTASSALSLSDSICGCLTFFLPVFFLSDYRGFRNKLPLPANRFLRVILYAAIAVSLFIAPAFVFTILSIFFA